MKSEFLKDKNFYKSMLSLAIPIAMQNLISSSLNMIDTVMIGGLGETQIAAVGLANQVFFFFSLLLFGINSGAAIFTAQFWGRKDIKNIRKMMGIAIISGGTISLFFTIGAFFTPGFILSIFTEDVKVINLGIQYLKIISFSYILTSVSYSYAFASRSIGKAKMPMFVSAVSLGINTILNYLLIYGKFGFPNMGIKGSALATLIARLIELVLILYAVYSSSGVLAGKISEMVNLTLSFIYRYLKTSIPVILNEALWSLGIIMYSIAYARIGTEAIASVQISNTIQNMFMIVSMGLGNACAIMIGNQIGSGNNEKAIIYAKRYSVIGPLIGIILGIALYLLSPLILSLFKVNADVHNTAARILAVMSMFLGFKMFNSILIVGILRSGGDTRFSLFLEMGSVWLVGVPMAFIGSQIWKLPVYLVVVLVSLEEVVKAAIGIPRVISKKWVKNVVEHM